MAHASEQLQREAEQTRAQLAETLQELRSRITPGQVIDDMLAYTRETAVGDFARNLATQVRREPLPVSLIGIGIAWLLWSTSRGSRPSSYSEETAASLAPAPGTMPDLEETRSLEPLPNTAEPTVFNQAADGMRERIVDRLKDAASSAYAGSSRAADRVSEIFADGNPAHTMLRAGRGLTGFLREHPLVLAGLGLALGAALSAALPPGETENKFMADARDALSGRPHGRAGQQSPGVLEDPNRPSIPHLDLAEDTSERQTTEALGIAPVPPS